MQPCGGVRRSSGVRARDAEFTAYVDGSRVRLARLAALLAGSPHEGEDLLQGVYLRMYARWRHLRQGELDAYARRALANAAVDRWRRVRREELRAEPPDDATRDASGEDRAVLVTALRALSPVARSVVVLRYYADLPEREVAAALGLPLGTVKSHAVVASPLCARPCPISTRRP